MPSSNHCSYGFGARDLALDLGVVDDHAALEVDEEELAGLQAALALDVGRRLVHHAGLRAQDDPAVLGLQPAAGAQAVAVQRRADHAAVGERDRRGAVPRLHQARVEGVEARAAPRAGRPGPGRPPGSSSSPRAGGCGRPARAARARCRTSRCRCRPGARPAAPSCRSSPKSSEASCDSRARIQLTLPRSVLISPLWAIIRYGCASSQRRERVGGEAAVDERERGLRARVREVREVAQDLRAREHALVDDRAAAEARDDELRAGGDLGHAADHVQLALERVLVGRELVGRGHDELLDVRRVEVGRDADVVLVDRDVAPGDDALALVARRSARAAARARRARSSSRGRKHTQTP